MCCYRKKTGFGAPLRQWLKNPNIELVNDLLSKSSINNRGLFNYNSVSHLLTLERQAKVDASYSLFSVMCIELWCRIFLDGMKV